ncbi:MAG: hypothetical protein QOJ94_2539 [Sphingomonadales bacterium]|jgi:hypothetical protein|nr:hypothetical protein [Sphingomonadales bacterium]MEA3062758.1 hypothetical protein [Sphingomonadales bacterium]
MIRASGLSAIVAAALSTAGCASFEGTPRAVPLTAVPNLYTLEEVHREIAAATTDADKRAIRNAAVAMHMRAYDEEYVRFLTSLGVDRKSANLVLEVGALGLSSIGAVAKGSANELSAAVAALTGTRASVNRELYYEQTLPAIIGAMEANRLRVKAEIRTHLINDDVATYPFEQALSDLVEYRAAQSLDRAILQVTKQAGQAADAQADRYENATRSCQPEAGLRPYWLRINHYVYGLAAAAPAAAGSAAEKKLDMLAAIDGFLTGTTPGRASTLAEAKAQAAAITNAAPKYCTEDAAKALLAKITELTGETVP